MLMTRPMSRVLEICVNLFLAVDRDVVELLGGTAGGTLSGAAAGGSPAAEDGSQAPRGR